MNTLMIDPSRLKTARLQKALSQRDLAKVSGVSLNTVNRLETGQREARLSTIKRLATALEIEILDISALSSSGETVWTNA